MTTWLVLAPIHAVRLAPRDAITLLVGERVRDLCWHGPNLWACRDDGWLVIPYGSRNRLELVAPEGEV